MIIKTEIIDIKKAESLIYMAQIREEYIFPLNLEKFSTIITEAYYEIIKELSSALNDYKTMPDGWKKDEIVELLNSLSGISPEQNAMIVLLKMLDIDNSDIQKLSGIKLPD